MVYQLGWVGLKSRVRAATSRFSAAAATRPPECRRCRLSGESPVDAPVRFIPAELIDTAGAENVQAMAQIVVIQDTDSSAYGVNQAKPEFFSKYHACLS